MVMKLKSKVTQESNFSAPRGAKGNRFASAICADNCSGASSSTGQQSTGLLHLNRFDSRIYISPTRKATHYGWLFLLVEPRGIEPLSESNLEGTSPGAVCYLHSLIPAGTNTLRDLVASLCVVRSKLCARTVSTQITPEPGSWTFRGGWAPN